ncbi:MAG TPA: glycoside hydrolase family 44 protein [Thermoanaerobaculia bacterium]|nr:glycoside hydrolase family 44 protein [Thermoanaerobaculia bacterium]
MKFIQTGFLLMLVTAAPALVAQNTATISVDASADRKPISPLIYGVAYASSSQLSDLNCPLNRSGGNATTRYNWQANGSNRAQDWYFESIGEASATSGENGDTFIADSRSGGAEPMLTIPMIGWVAKLGANRGKLASYSIAKYGAQTGNDWQWYADAGNGISSATGQKISTNNPNDANLPADSAFQQAWMQHLVTQWGKAGSGGLRYYILDNEPSIWQETHHDVHPVGPTMDEIRDKIIDYGGKVKATDPNGIVVAPEEWGWSGYFYSGYDQQYGAAHNWSSFPDRINHGGADYLPWLLDQLRRNELSTGKRILDIFTVHYYPQGGEFGNDTSSSMQLRRNRSTRSLWDPNYVDETWISDKVQLIPRLRGWVGSYYPGTRIGVTEYNWGAEGHINGATAQADVLGIFGREGLDVATRWTTPDASSPTYKSIRIYRNYDGQHSTFGDTSVRATTANPDNLSSFAALRSSDGSMTVMVISKVLSGSTATTIALSNFTAAATAQAWQLTSSNTINRLPDVAVSGNSISTSLPSQSITLFVIPASSSSCTYSISPASQSFVSNGGSGSINVVAGQGCTWTATSNASWIVASTAGSGNGTVGYTVAMNLGAARSGSISVGGLTFTANQTAAVAAPTATVSGGGSICFGSSSAIAATLTGSGPWSLTWSDGVQQNGVTASPATRTVAPTVSTTYSVTAVSDSISSGTAAGSAVVTVRTAPVITQQPLSRVVRKRKTAVVSVTATGSSPLGYQWYEGASGDPSKPVGTNSSTYTTPALTASASYWVRVSNSCGAVNSNTATLSVR